MMLTNLDIYFSAACNLNCIYCHMPHIQSNKEIIKALQDGSFAQKVNAALEPSIERIGIWGFEPTINGEYFKDFIYTILDNNPQIKYIFMPTNGTNKFYRNFVIPLNDYCLNNKHKLIFEIQIGLDGPEKMHENHTHNWVSHDYLITNIDELCSYFQTENKYFRVKLFNKSTLTKNDLYTDPNEWWKYMRKINSIFKRYENYSLKINLMNPPTIAMPGKYTKEDGQELVKWQLKFNTKNEVECAAGITSRTIDYQGTIWDCH